MGLFDVIDDIAEKQITKTEHGDNRIYGVVVGTVTDNYAEEMPGRVCVQIQTRDKNSNVLKWARVAMPSSGTGWGHYFLPEVGDQVLIVFEQGNIEKPYVIGCVPKDSNNFLKKAVDEKNTYKKITTKHGSSIVFTDSGEEGGDAGEKDIIEIYTPDMAHKFIMDNDKKQILISDKEGLNKIEFNTEKGEISIKADKKLTINVGDDIELSMTGSNGTTELKTKAFKIQAENSVEISADKQFKTESPTVKVEGTSAVKISGGPVTIEGSPIKIG